MIHEELSREITPNAFGVEVLNGLKPGLDEKLYERAMIIPDLIVDDVVIVDPKVVFLLLRDASRPNHRISKHHPTGPGPSH